MEGIDPLSRLEALEENAELTSQTLQQQYEFNRMVYDQVMKLVVDLNTERNRVRMLSNKIQKLEKRLTIIEEINRD